MASLQPVRTLRSPPMASSSHGNNNHLLLLDDTTPQKTPHHNPHKNANKNTTFNQHLGAMSPESLDDGTTGESDDAGSEAESDGEDADDAETPDDHTPSSNANAQTQAGANAATGGMKQKTKEGLSCYDSDSDVADQDDDENFDNQDDDENFDIKDDDDDYDGVDIMSPTTDQSEQFEAEVENEIFAAGEDGIDWDAPETYAFNPAADGAYYIEPPFIGMNNFLGFSFDDIGFETELSTRTPTPGPLAPNLDFGQPLFSEKTVEYFPGWVSSSADSETSDVPSRKASVETGETSVVQRHPSNGYETEEEDFPAAPTGSSVVQAGAKKAPKLSSPNSRVITSSTPRKVGLKKPVLRKIALDPNKPVAFFTDGQRVMRFLTPKGHTLKWIDMRRFGSDSEDSSPDSPTMIDLDAALGDGNTRTGAAITDTLHGVIFRQHHCDPEMMLTPFVETASAPVVEFARVPILNAGSFAMFGSGFSHAVVETGSNSDGHTSAGESALDLIDFEGGVMSDDLEYPLSHSTRYHTPPPSSVLPKEAGTPRSDSSPGTPTRGKGKGKGKGKGVAKQGISSSTTLSEERFSAMKLSSSSPLKRRASKSLEVDAGTVSPASTKRKRRDIASREESLFPHSTSVASDTE